VAGQIGIKPRRARLCVSSRSRPGRILGVCIFGQTRLGFCDNLTHKKWGQQSSIQSDAP